ncbi:BolA like protein [Zostera marina]|uniref:BolA like protein n=1 Tax=Zostera marina TaxID=29655 RepID=A0A0K9P930_ZOSMR|nr:BolA like protein [Zostera marina]
MSSISSSPIRLFHPQIRRINRRRPITTNILKTQSFFISIATTSSPSSITFTPLSKSSPIKSHLQDATNPTTTVDQTTLPKNLQDIIVLFQSVQDPKAKYHQLLHYGNRLPPLAPQYKTDRHRVKGCVSQVWVHAFPDPDDSSSVRFEADSDSALTKGLAALLVLGLSGASPEVISGIPPEFVQLLGLKQSLTPSRNNGFLNMLKLMQRKAVDLLTNQDNEEYVSDVSVTKSEDVGTPLVEIETVGPDLKDIKKLEPLNKSEGRGARIRDRLEKHLSPVDLEVENISHQHAGHAGVRGINGDGDTHFNLKIVSKEFEGKSMLKRHRLVYDLLQEELQSGLHALSIVAKTPSECQ